MRSFGDLLTQALAERPSRGQVVWVANKTWQLALYAGAKAEHHPGLVCCARPTLAPGTSNRRAARRDYGNAFTLSYPDALNGRSSTFFLGLRRFVPPHRFSRFIGRIHEDDLHRLNEALGPESEERHGAN